MEQKARKILAMLLGVVTLVVVLPINAFAAIDFNPDATNDDYYKLISKKDWTLAPGVNETEIVLNNDEGTRRQVVHSVVVDMNNPYNMIIPGYKGMIPKEGSYGVEATSTQAKNAEALGYGNVVAATNAMLSWYDSEYYKNHPEYIGEPLYYSILNGYYYENSQGAASFNKNYAVLVINYDNHPITGEPRPEDMPKVTMRSQIDALTGWEQNAISVWTFLVKPDSNDPTKGKSVYSDATHAAQHTSDKASRTFVGVKADGSIVLSVSDGEQMPYSDGFSMSEMADYMIKMGCIWAANCDGGGSTTFVTERPGEELKVNCSLSDGGERPTTNTLLVISSAPADGVFANANLSTDYDYYTPDSTVKFSVLGTDAVGTPVDIPDDVKWSIKEEGMGTIDHGIFKSIGTTGQVTAQVWYKYTDPTTGVVSDKLAGEKSITIVVPEALSFEQSIVTIPFGKTVTIPVKATATINDVAQEIGLGADDVKFTTTNNSLGSFNGLNFTAVSETNAPEDISATVIAELQMGTNPTASVEFKIGKASEVLWDFEGGQVDIDEWNVINNRKGTHWDYELKLSLADRTNGKVHDGNYSMRLETNGLSSKDSHSKQYAWIRLGVDGDAIVLNNAKTVGFWLYVPEDNIQCWVQGHYMYDSDGNGSLDAMATVSMMPSEKVFREVDESGWHYLTMDISQFKQVALKYETQFDKDPSDGTEGEKGEFFLALIFHKATNNLLWANNGSINGNYTYYIDSFTVDYSEAVDDRENPVFGTPLMDGAELVRLADDKFVYTTTTNEKVSFSINVADATVRKDATGVEHKLYNVSGLNAKTAKIYVDGVEINSTFANGVLSAYNLRLPDGFHRVKFEICDNVGNKSVVIRVIKVENGFDVSTIHVVPADPKLDRIPFGSIYYMNLEATQIETIQKVETVIDLNNVNHWELDHMEVAYGFEAEYTIDEETNTATISFTRTGNLAATGNAVLAKLPIRVLYFDTDIQVPGYTAETYWTNYLFWAQDVKVDVDKGVITYVGSYSTKFLNTFSNEKFHVDTEMYTSKDNMDKTYLAEHGTTHVHTVASIADKAATCTENGYTGRTFCEGCNSVIEWGETTLATGHTLEIAGDKLACDCGEAGNFTGLIEIAGKNYYAVNGNLTSGWIGIGEDWYFFDKTSFEGWNGERYTDKAIQFTFDNGLVTHGTWVKTKQGVRYWYGPGYYKDMSPDTISSRPYEIDGKTYLFDKNGYMKTGIAIYFDAAGPGGALAGEQHIYYDCGEDGAAVLLTGAYDGYYYKEGRKVKAYQIVQGAEGEFYFLTDGNKLAMNTTVYLTNQYIQDYTYADGTPLTEGYYTFDVDGKMVIKNGVYDGYMYINNERVNRYALINYDGDYYFVGDGRKIAVDKTIYFTADYLVGLTYADGSSLKPGYYTFDADGKMVIKNGVYDGYMFINNEKVERYALVELQGDFYFVGDYRKVTVNKTVYLTENFLEGFSYTDGSPLKPGYYTFDADGKMVFNADTVKNGVIDGYMYINNERVNRYALINYDGDYYFVSDGRKVAVDKTIYLTADYLDGFTYEDGSPLKPGYFAFGADGKMVINNGIVDGYMYINNERVNRYAPIYFGGDYYFVGDGRKVAVDKTIYLTEEYLVGLTYADGSSLKPGYYTFGTDGKMVIKSGIYDGYMYINNERIERYALIEYEGNFYYVGDYRKIVTDKKQWLSAEDVAGKCFADGCMIEVGYHYFDKYGKLVY